MKMLFNFNDEIKEIDANEEIFIKNNLLDNMYEIEEEYGLEKNQAYKSQFDSNLKTLNNLVIKEIEKHYRPVNMSHFNYYVFFPRDEDAKNGVTLRIRAKDHDGILGITFSDEEADIIIEFIKKLKN